MSKDTMLSAIQQFSELKLRFRPGVVVFTGGEVTLYKELLLDGIKTAHERNFITRVVTNGWWASSPAKAEKWIREFKDAGLDEINTSYDYYHAQFMRFQNICNLVSTALNYNLRIAIGTVISRNEINASYIKSKLSECLKIDTNKLDEKITIIEDYPTPVGEAESIYKEDPSLFPNDPRRKKLNQIGCANIGTVITVLPDGTIKACCGHPIFYTDSLTIGNIKEEGLLSAVKLAQSNLLHYWIHITGPVRILDKIGIKGEQYAGPCHACNLLFNKYYDKVLNYLKQNKDDVLVNDILLNENLRRILYSAKENLLGSNNVTP